MQLRGDAVALFSPNSHLHLLHSPSLLFIMSSRRSYVRENFAAAMRKQEDTAHSTPATPRRSESIPRPSHPAFDRLEEMEVKQLKEVSNNFNLPRIRLS